MLTPNLEFYGDLCRVYRDEAAKHGHDVAPHQAAGWGGIMICAPTDAQAQEWMAAIRWFWNNWPMPFGQGLPELLVGAPDTISRRIDEAARAVPIEDVFLLIPQGIHSRDQIMTSLELFSTKVMPRFAAAG